MAVAPTVVQWFESPLIEVKYRGVAVKPQLEVSTSIRMYEPYALHEVAAWTPVHRPGGT